MIDTSNIKPGTVLVAVYGRDYVCHIFAGTGINGPLYFTKTDDGYVVTEDIQDITVCPECPDFKIDYLRIARNKHIAIDGIDLGAMYVDDKGDVFQYSLKDKCWFIVANCLELLESFSLEQKDIEQARPLMFERFN